MKRFPLAPLLTLMAACFAPGADPVKVDPKAAAEDAAARHERLAREFLGFTQGTARLATRLASSTSPADRERAGVLQKALEVVRREGMTAKVETLTERLKR